MSNKFKEYQFAHQKHEFRLRIYTYGVSAKLYMDDLLRDVSVPNGMHNPVLDYTFKDTRKQEHHIKVERKQHWFKYNYIVSYDDRVIYKTMDNDPIN